MNASGMGKGLRKLSSDFVTGFISEAGTQQTNKDFFAHIPLDGYACWVVAETYDNDDVPSAKIAVETVLGRFKDKPTLSKRKLRAYVQAANDQLIAQSGQYQRKASIMVVATDYKKVRYAQCGDCRFYWFRNNTLWVRSNDQSLMGRMIDSGAIQDDNVQGKEESRNLTAYLGQKSHANVFVSKKMDMQDQDVLLLCTWGIWDKLSMLEMLDSLEDAKTADEFIENMQNLLLSKQQTIQTKRGRSSQTKSKVDNYTAAAVFVNKTYVVVRNTRKYIKLALIILIPLLIIGIIIAIITYQRNVRRNEVMAVIAQFTARGDMHFVDQNFSRAFSEYDSALIESRNLTGRMRRRVAENENIREGVTARLRVAQLILDGEDHFNAGRYEEARNHFQRAIQAARFDVDVSDLLDHDHIEHRITLSHYHSNINSLILLGEMQADLGQFADALASLNDARDLAITAGNRTAVSDIRLRTNEVTSRANAEAANAARLLSEAEQRTREENIARIERNLLAADSLAAAGDSIRARQLYNEAIIDFIAIGEAVRASDAQRRLANMESNLQNEQHEASLQAIEIAILGGERALADGDFERALRVFEQASWDLISIGEMGRASVLQYRIIESGARQRNEAIGRVTREIELAMMEGELAAATGDFDRAIQIFERAVVEFIEAGDIAGATAARFRVLDIRAIQDTASHSAIVSSIEVAMLTAELVKNAGDYRTAIQLYTSIANDFTAIGEIVRAANIQRIIIELDERIGQQGRTQMIRSIEADILDGDIAAAMGQDARAIAIYEQAARDFLALGEADRAAEVRSRILALEQARREHADNVIANNARDLRTRAEIAFANGQTALAISLFQEAGAIFMSLGMAQDAALMTERIRQVNESVANAEIAVQVDEARALERSGDMHLSLNNFDLARDFYRRAQAIFQRLNLLDEVREMHDKIALANEREAEFILENEQRAAEQVRMRAEMAMQQGNTYMVFSEFERALAQFIVARDLFIQINAFDRAIMAQDRVAAAELAMRQAAQPPPSPASP